MSIRFRLGLIVIGVLAAISLFVWIHFPGRARAAALGGLDEVLGVVARTTAYSVGPSLLFEDKSSAADTLAGARQATGVSYLVVEDRQGRVFAAIDLEVAQLADYRVRTSYEESGLYYRMSAPATHQGRRLGTVYVGTSLAPLNAEIDRIRNSIGLLSAVMFLIATGLTVGLGSYLTKPLAAMATTAREIMQGRRDRRAPVTSNDEMGELARSMNLMLDHLQEAQVELESLNRGLEQRVAQRTVQLERQVGERRRSEEALQRANLRFSLAAAAVEGAIYDYDVASGAIEWTNGLERVFGYPVDETLASQLWRLAHVHPEDLERYRDQLAEDIEAGRDLLCEYRFLCRSGRYFHVWDRARAIRDAEGRTVRMVGVIENITALRELEEQFFHAQRMEAVGRLAGGVAHDFNNLLTTILGYCDILLGRVSSDAETAQPVREIRRASERAAALTEQLLAFGRRQVIHPQLLDLNDVVRDLEQMLRRVVGEDIRIETDLTAGQAAVFVDRGQLEQLIMNVVVNSRDAMLRGGNLTLRTGQCHFDEAFVQGNVGAKVGDYCLLEVVDTGCGMDEETLAKIFEPFFTTKAVGRGTGLGMAIVYGIVNQSHGHLKVTSSPGRGTTVSVFLPRQTAVVVPEQPVAAPLSAPGGSESVLLVEDEDALRRMITTLLSTRGYQVTAASNPEEALRRVREASGQFELIVSDVVMPGMSGRDMVDQVRKEWPGIPVLFVSGYAGDMVLEHGVSGEQVAFLAKPFTLDELLGRVRSMLDVAPA
jgi:PAS domain S-box-containing protein